MNRTSERGGPEWRALPPARKTKAAAQQQQVPPRQRTALPHTTSNGDLDWTAPPPQRGRTEPIRPEEVSAGMHVRRWIEADRRRRGIPPNGLLMDGETEEPRRKHT